MSIKQLYGQYWHNRFKFMITSTLNFWKNIINFKGKTSRWELLWASIGNTFLMIPVSIILGILCASLKNFLPMAIFFTAYMIAGLSMTIRRLHDVNRGWYNIFWVLLPVIGTIIFFLAIYSPGVDELCEMFGVDNGNGDNQENQVDSAPVEEQVNSQSRDMSHIESDPLETDDSSDEDLSNEELTLD